MVFFYTSSAQIASSKARLLDNISQNLFKTLSCEFLNSAVYDDENVSVMKRDTQDIFVHSFLLPRIVLSAKYVSIHTKAR